MGFREPRETARVVGEDEYAGFEAEVLIRPIPFGWAMRLIARAKSDDDVTVIEALREFGDRVLVGWNLEDADGLPVPPTGEALVEHDSGLMMRVFSGWAEAIQSSPLPQKAAISR